MRPTDLISTLLSIDQIETWKQASPQLNQAERLELYAMVEPLWLERMYKQNRLYINWGELERLQTNGWKPNARQKQMIWASVIGSIESQSEKHRFRTIKDALIKKYGKQWWYECDNRVKDAFKARLAIKKRAFEWDSPIHGSAFLSSVSNDVIKDILSKLPK